MIYRQALATVRLAVFLACLSSISTTLAAVNESFPTEPGYASGPLALPMGNLQAMPVPFLWAQTGTFAEPGRTSSRDSTGNSSSAMKLSRAHPAAETALLDWDNTTTTTTTITSSSSGRDVTFKFCSSREWCQVSPGSLTLSWSNDSIVWQPLWNHTFVDLPSTLALGPGCTWEAVTVPIPAAAAAAGHIAFKWVHLDASPTREASSPCSKTLLDDILLPVQPPSAVNMEYGKAPLASANLTDASCAACGHLCGTGSGVTMGGVGVGGGGGR